MNHRWDSLQHGSNLLMFINYVALICKPVAVCLRVVAVSLRWTTAVYRPVALRVATVLNDLVIKKFEDFLTLKLWTTSWSLQFLPCIVHYSLLFLRVMQHSRLLHYSLETVFFYTSCYSTSVFLPNMTSQSFQLTIQHLGYRATCKNTNLDPNEDICKWFF